jgi:DHA2 family multidrug resistance protein
MMMCMSPITELALGRLPVEYVPNASSLYSLMRYLGGGIGIAVINTLVELRTALHNLELAEAVNPARYATNETLLLLNIPLSSQTTDVMQTHLGGLSILSAILNRESLLMTCNDIWFLIATLFAIGFLLMPAVQKVPLRNG